MTSRGVEDGPLGTLRRWMTTETPEVRFRLLPSTRTETGSTTEVGGVVSVLFLSVCVGLCACVCPCGCVFGYTRKREPVYLE